MDASASVKMKEFLSGPMGDKPVTALPGIESGIETKLIAEVGSWSRLYPSQSLDLCSNFPELLSEHRPDN